MLNRLIGMTRWVLAEFGPLIAFWSLTLAAGIKAGIAGSVVFIIGDSLWRWRKGLEFTKLYVLVSSLTLIFGIIDLIVQAPFLLKYEAVITNVMTGAAFVLGSRGQRPIVLEIAEQRQRTVFPNTPDVVRFFQIFTLIWAGYFFVKAGFYFAVGQWLPMVQALAVRSVVGSISMVLMVTISATQGPRLFGLFQRLGWLPARPSIAQ